MTDPNKPFTRKPKPVVRTFGPAAQGGSPKRSPAPKDRATRAEMDTVHGFIEQERRFDAIEVLDNLITKYPKDIVLYAMITNTLIHVAQEAADEGDEDAAYTHFEQSTVYAMNGLKIKPADTPLLCACARSFSKMGDFDNSNLLYERALTIDPNDSQNYVSAAYMHLSWSGSVDAMDEYKPEELLQEAAELFQKAINLGIRKDGVFEKLERLKGQGYIPSEEGFTLDDPALDLINDAPDIAETPPPRRLVSKPSTPGAPSA